MPPAPTTLTSRWRSISAPSSASSASRPSSDRQPGRQVGAQRRRRRRGSGAASAADEPTRRRSGSRAPGRSRSHRRRAPCASALICAARLFSCTTTPGHTSSISVALSTRRPERSASASSRSNARAPSTAARPRPAGGARAPAVRSAEAQDRLGCRRHGRSMGWGCRSLAARAPRIHRDGSPSPVDCTVCFSSGNTLPTFAVT